jgi:hypothetical protein
MITKVPLEYAGDGRHGKANERPLTRVKSMARFDQSCAGDLQQVLLVLAAMYEPAGERSGQPQVRADDLVKDLLTPGGASGLSLEKKVAGTFGEFFARRLLVSRSERNFGDRHKRDTLRNELRVWRASRPRSM